MVLKLEDLTILVPDYGKCLSIGGEIVRAISRIETRFYNDGEYIGVENGNDTLNAPARFLCENTNSEIRKTIENMWGNFYKVKELDNLINKVLDFLYKHKELFNTLNKMDMFAYKRKDDSLWFKDDNEF